MVACSFFFFSGPKPASAAETTYDCECSSTPLTGNKAGCYDNKIGEKKSRLTVSQCDDHCKGTAGATYALWGNHNSAGHGNYDVFCRPLDGTEMLKQSAKGAAQIAKAAAGIDSCVGILGMVNPAHWIPCLLMAVLRFLGWILTVAAIIFGWAAKAQTLTSVINGPLIYESWQLVRDSLNIAFIMMLLYTAFTIIFQVDKSNKKIILTVVLMALLVNFSFPVARFIIDIGNSLMYTIFNSLFNGADPTGIFTGITDRSSIVNIIEPKGIPTIAQLLASVVFIGILAITFLMMAMLFVLRIVVLAIIIIFSPIGFVGLLFPSVASKIDWWGNLFKYTFFGPAMAFMLYIAIQLMQTTIDVSSGITNFGVFSENDDILKSMSTFAIPVVVLWIGMGVAQKMGIEGAAMIQKWATATFNKVSGVSWAKRQGESFMAQRKARQDEKDKGNIGNRTGKLFNKIQDNAHGFFSVKDPVTGKPTHSIIPGAKKAWERAARMKTEEHRKDVEDKAKEVKAGSTTVNIVNNVNSSFDSAGNIISATKDQAGYARAFTDRSSDDKKDFIEDQLANTGIGTWTTNPNLANILGNVATNPRVQAALNRIQNPLVLNKDEKDLRAIATYISQQSEEVVKKYVND